jgi:hypothetical protein
MVHKIDSQKVFDILFLSGIWILIFILINPFHDFPLNDDWSFSLTVKYLVEDGVYLPQDWLAFPLLTQALWGTLFCLPFGFSFSALTVSTLALGLAGILFTYFLTLEISGDRRFSVLAGLLIATNPLYTHLSLGFMSDVPFYAFFVSSVYFYMLSYKRKNRIYLFAGVLLAIMAMFIRQYGLIIPIAFLLFEVLSRKKTFGGISWLHFATVILFITALTIYNRWLAATDRLPEMYWSVKNLSAFSTTLEDYAWRIYTRVGLVILQTGLWLFPLLLAGVVASFSLIRKNYKILVIILVVFIMPMIRMLLTLPVGNNFYDLGLGVLTTRDFFIEYIPPDIFSVPWIWYIIWPLSFAGGLMFVLLISVRVIHFWKLIRAAKMATSDFYLIAGLISFLLFILYMGISMINFTFFDRYILCLLLMAIILIIPQKSLLPKKTKWPVYIAIIFLVVQLSFSIAANRFYLDWSRNKWMAARELMEQGVPAQKIDGGHEFNFWHGAEFDKYGRWNTDNYDYVICFIELDGFQTIRRYPVSGSLSGNVNEILLLKRQ